MKYIPLVGRILYSTIFISSGLGHFFQLNEMSQYTASMGVPFPTAATFLTGLMLLGGGFSVLLGYKVKIGMLILVAFLVPTSFIAHSFWGIEDAMQAQMQMVMFMKNIALTGSALIFYYFGTGPFSVDKLIEIK